MNEFALRIDTFSDEIVISRLLAEGLLRSDPPCPTCSVPMLQKATTDSSDGYNWRCMNGRCGCYQSTLSIRAGSWFATSKLPLKTLIKFMHHYSTGALMTTISSATGINYRTTLRLADSLKAKIVASLSGTVTRMGGAGIIIQADETKLNFNVKAHHGHTPRTQIWALTIVDTSFQPARGFAQIVPNRGKDVLTSIIKSVVREGSVIYTDEWAGYGDLGVNGYVHCTVCHKNNFVDRTTGVHTQNVKAYNNKVKSKIKEQKGIRDGNHEEWLKVFMFFDNNRPNVFIRLVDLIKL